MTQFFSFLVCLVETDNLCASWVFTRAFCSVYLLCAEKDTCECLCAGLCPSPRPQRAFSCLSVSVWKLDADVGFVDSGWS